MASRPDSTAIAAMDARYIKPAFLAYLDIVGDPLRATTWPANLTFAGDYPDPDMAGHTFVALQPDFIDISDVRFQEGGAETVTCKLSGLILPDNDLLNILNDEANWRGRPARLWQAIYNENNVQQGVFWNYYTGRMVGMPITGSPDLQVIELEIETYLASLSGPSNRTYLDQGEFDPGDESAAASIAIANGNSSGTLSGGDTGSGINGGGGAGSGNRGGGGGGGTVTNWL